MERQPTVPMVLTVTMVTDRVETANQIDRIEINPSVDKFHLMYLTVTVAVVNHQIKQMDIHHIHIHLIQIRALKEVVMEVRQVEVEGVIILV